MTFYPNLAQPCTSPATSKSAHHQNFFNELNSNAQITGLSLTLGVHTDIYRNEGRCAAHSEVAYFAEGTFARGQYLRMEVSPAGAWIVEQTDQRRWTETSRSTHCRRHYLGTVRGLWADSAQRKDQVPCQAYMQIACRSGRKELVRLPFASQEKFACQKVRRFVAAWVAFDWERIEMTKSLGDFDSSYRIRWDAVFARGKAEYASSAEMLTYCPQELVRRIPQPPIPEICPTEL